MGLYDYTVYNIIVRNAKVLGDQTGWIYGEERITHKQFLQRIDVLAAGLLSVGLGRGDRIGVLAQNSMAYVYLYGAAAKTGAIMLPINWRLQPDEVEYVISDCSPKVMFVGTDFQALASPLISKFDLMFSPNAKKTPYDE